MARFDFDLECALIELERVNNLLGIFNEFCGEECPTEDIDKMPSINAVVFCARAQQYASLIDAAQDKILALIKNMNSAIENHFSEAKKAKGGAA